MGDSAPIKVMIVDDSELLRAGLRAIVEAEDDFECVGEFGEAGAALDQLETLRPDVVLMSVTMPDMSGYAACARIVDLDPGARVVMLTPEHATEGVLSTVTMGGAGYLPKNGSRADLISTIRANGNGAMYLVPAVAEDILKSGRNSPSLVNVSSLSPREKQVLGLLVQGLTDEEIAEKLTISRHTVRNHASKVFAKLNISGRASLLSLPTTIRLLSDC